VLSLAFDYEDLAKLIGGAVTGYGGERDEFLGRYK
jgi:hypothetical protein